MTFEHDVFISYAHIDNQPVLEGEKGWIADLERVLKVRLAQIRGQEAKIWRDPKLQGNDYFADDIGQQLQTVRVLVSIVTPRYVKSEWCTREVKEFVAAAEATGGVRVGTKSRIFKVVKTPVPHDEHPEELRDLLGYEFFTVDSETGRPRELGMRGSREADPAYWARLEDLAYDISALLESLEDRAAGKSAEESGADGAASGKTIFLADTTSDIGEERDRIRRELTEHGHVVLPRSPFPMQADPLRDAVAACLAEADMSVHLIGGRYGVIPEGAQRSVIDLQNLLAAERSQEADMPRIIWLPRSLKPAEERQAAFIQQLEEDEALQRGAEVVKTSVENLKTIIDDKIRPPVRAAPVRSNGAAAGAGAPRRIYLICDAQDMEVLTPIGDYLFERGFEVIFPVLDGAAAEVSQDYRENLKLADAFLIYYGGGNEAWLRAKLRDLIKAPGYGREQPILAKAIYVGPPDAPAKKRLRTHEALVLREDGAFAPEALSPLLEKLAPGEGAGS